MDLTRIGTLQRVASGTATATDRDYLRTGAAWFPASTASSTRDHRLPPATDDELRTAASAFLLSEYGIGPTTNARTSAKRAANHGWASAFSQAAGRPFSHGGIR